MKTAHEKLEIGRKIWILYHQNNTVKQIACQLKVNPTIVSTILNYSSSQIVGVSDEKFWNVIHILVERIQILKQELKNQKGEKNESRE